MKIATTTGDFRHYCKTDEERILELHLAGFRYIDLDMYTFTENCVYMQDNWQGEVQKLKDLASELGMQFVQAHSQGGNPLSDDEKHVDFIYRATVRSIEICKMLGIKNTVVHSGFGAGLSKEEWFEKNKKFYERLFPAMEYNDVNVLCENSTKANMGNMYFINSGKDMREFIEYVDHPKIHACWDTGHANCEGAQYNEIMALGKELFAIHYNDNSGRLDEHLVPFAGTLNHDEIMTALKDVGYKGYFTLESSSTLRTNKYWLGNRREFNDKTTLASPQLFMQRHLEKMLYETAEWILSSYSVLEK